MNRELENEEVYQPEVDMDEVRENSHTDCPRCEQKRLDRATAKNTKYKQCGNCGGAWFSLSEMNKAFGGNIKFTMPENAKAFEGMLTEKPMCPTCKAKLVSIKSIDLPGAEVKACLICQGRWIDGKEIEKLQNKGFLTQIKHFVMRLFSL